MNTLIRIFGLLVLPLCLSAQDVVYYPDGTTREVEILAVQGDAYLITLPSPIPGQPGGKTTMKRAGIAKIIFGPDPLLKTIESNKSEALLASARLRWQNLEPLLGTAESYAGWAGCLLGEILLLSDDPARHGEALEIFKKVEAGAWNVADRQRATRGRLVAMMKKGQLEEASAEAEEIAKLAEDPDLLIETKLVLAQARIASLRRLLDENPRWSEDPPVQADRVRLIHEAADFALFPFLFHGTKHEQAAQGLWLAHDTYALAGDEPRAAEVLGDIAEIYPDTARAGEAKATLAKSVAAPAPAAKPAPEAKE
jgi:hypothetical protein